MTEDLITLARKAMALPGAPIEDIAVRREGRPWNYPLKMVDHEDIWNLSDTTPAGWALGGVLLGALGDVVHEITRHDDGTWSILADDDRGGLTRWAGCKTVRVACCRVAVDLGRWPGGVE